MTDSEEQHETREQNKSKHPFSDAILAQPLMAAGGYPLVQLQPTGWPPKTMEHKAPGVWVQRETFKSNPDATQADTADEELALKQAKQQSLWKKLHLPHLSRDAEKEKHGDVIIR